jgi:retron-type reverse transcriptase
VAILKDIFTSITSIEALFAAHKKALKGKRNNYFATAFDFNLTSQLNKLQSELTNNLYQPYAYRKKIINEPKTRLIEAPAYRDRIVHHALYHYLSPFYEKHFIADSYACRPGRGIHKATARVQHFLRQGGLGLYVCQLDISKYYASVNHDKLLEILQSKIDDPSLINLLRIIIDSTDSGAEHDALFAPDSYYFTKGRRGIPIGNLTSQLFANIYLHQVDMFAKQTLKIKHYVRYMDDILFFSSDKIQLHEWQQAMTKYLYEELYLTINPRKIRLYPTSQGVSFVGYVIHPNFLLLRSSSVRRFKKRYRKQLHAMMNEQLDLKDLRESFASWKAHAMHASSDRLVAKLESSQQDYLFARGVKRYYHKHRLVEVAPLTQLSFFDRE